MNDQKIEQIYYIDSKAEDACSRISTCLSFLLEGYTGLKSSPVFVCIGSDRVTGDSLGPMIGSELKKVLKKDIPVYGTLEMPIHALNLNDTLSAINEQHKKNIIIAIDASLGTRDHQGYITLGKGSLSPGAGVEKDLESVGDIFITGIIGVSSRFSHLTLQTTRLSAVMAVAEQITAGVLKAFGYRAVPQPEIPVFSACTPLSIAGASLEANRYMVR